MPTIISHAVVAATIGYACSPLTKKPSEHYWLVFLTLAILPDADVLAFVVGIPYEHFFGHRGFFHSLVFAIITTALATRFITERNVLVIMFLTITAASHGVLDCLTNGGLGIALLSPFDNTRYFFPLTPVEVSPIGRDFFSQRGLSTLISEIMWLWLPCLVLSFMIFLIRLQLRARVYP